MTLRLPLVAVGLWEDRTWRRAAVLAVPFLSTAVVYLGASQEVAAAQVAASVLPEPVLVARAVGTVVTPLERQRLSATA